MNSDSVSNPVGGEAAPFVPSEAFKRYDKLKRALDLFFALLLFILAAIPCSLICILIRATSRGPALFRQTRIGRYGKPFHCLKFRTMYTDAPQYCATPDLRDADSFITPVGKILRKTSLDELPQLFNVIKGDMSFIGPRPLIPEEKDIHEERMKRGVYELRPGISGLAQINGRDRVGAEEKVMYDEKYLHNVSFTYDAKILLGTFFGVLRGNDIVEGKK